MFFSYLGSPRFGTKMSGLYLHSPASEGMWMEAHQKHTGKGVPAPTIRNRLFLDSHLHHNTQERSHEQPRKSPQDQLHRIRIDRH